MHNSTFLVLLRPIFPPKIKTAPPLTGLGSRICLGLAVIWTRTVDFFCCGAHPKLVKIFSFWRSSNFGRKNGLNFGEDLFFGDHPIFTEKLHQFNSNLMKILVKFVYCCFKLQKKPHPHFAKSWLRV